MGFIHAWIICLLGVSLLGNAYAQGTCHICNKTAPREACVVNFFPSHDIKDGLCESLAQDKILEKTTCKKYPNGYRTFCKQAITGNEYECIINCPPPPVIQEKYYGGPATALRPAEMAVTLLTGCLVTVFTRFAT